MKTGLKAFLLLNFFLPNNFKTVNWVFNLMTKELTPSYTWVDSVLIELAKFSAIQVYNPASFSVTFWIEISFLVSWKSKELSWYSVMSLTPQWWLSNSHVYWIYALFFAFLKRVTGTVILRKKNYLQRLCEIILYPILSSWLEKLLYKRDSSKN